MVGLEAKSSELDKEASSSKLSPLLERLRQTDEWVLGERGREPDLAEVGWFRERLARDLQDGLIGGEKKISQSHWNELMDEKRPQVIWRYIIAVPKEVEAKLDRIRNALKYREELGVDRLNAEQTLVKDFWLKSSLGFTGETSDGKAVLYSITKNTRKVEGAECREIIKRFVLNLIFSWEKEHLTRVDSQMVVVFDFTGASLRNMDLEFASWFLSVIQLIPYRISGLFFVGVHYLFRPFVKLIIGMLPEHSRKFVHCVSREEMLEGERPLLTLDQVPVEAGGRASDRWRLAPSHIPWASQVPHRFSSELLAKLDACICVNTSRERIEQLMSLQREHDKLLGQGNGSSEKI